MSAAVQTAPAEAPSAPRKAPLSAGRSIIVALLALLSLIWVVPLAFILINSLTWQIGRASCRERV